jgi:hypothetical protein
LYRHTFLVGVRVEAGHETQIKLRELFPPGGTPGGQEILDLGV